MATETTVSESETTVSDGDTIDGDVDGRSGPSDVFSGAYMRAILRMVLVFVGVFLLFAALGQLSGIDILGLSAELLGTDVGRWLMVAVVAIVLIAVAVYGFNGRTD